MAICIFSILFVAIFLSIAVDADPIILLTNAQAKCMSVEAPAEATLNIQYEAPDLIMPSDMKENGKPVDPRNYRRFRTTITISQNEGRENKHGARSAHNNPRVDKYKNKDQDSKVVKDLETKTGNIEYITRQDGLVSICIQSLVASAVSPTPISLRVTESSGSEESVSDTPPDKTTLPNVDTQSQRNAKEHFSQMEKTLSGLISKTDMILRQADYAKELEVEFHEQSIAMNKASQWWPIVQLCVLLVTGFTQANHMINFFRKHHIF